MIDAWNKRIDNCRDVRAELSGFIRGACGGRKVCVKVDQDEGSDVMIVTIDLLSAGRDNSDKVVDIHHEAVRLIERAGQRPSVVVLR